MLFVRPWRPEEWSGYRSLRLSALRDSPDAFASTYADACSRSDEDWAGIVRRAHDAVDEQLLVAEKDGSPIGLLWCKRAADEPEAADLFQMWVAPANRGQGVGRALVAEALHCAAGQAVRCVRLEVAAADSPAWRLYMAMRFEPSGPQAPLRDGSALRVQPMARRLDRA